MRLCSVLYGVEGARLECCLIGLPPESTQWNTKQTG